MPWKKVSEADYKGHGGCPHLYDLNQDIPGLCRYYCENSTDPGMGLGTRIPIRDMAQVNNFCKGNYNRCPRY